MPGGLINIVSFGTANVILNGNPSKTFFKSIYKKYTNFGLQRFRLDFEGQRNLDWNSDTMFEFKIKRYAELMWDTYLVVNLPDIWSPFYPRPDISGNTTGPLENVNFVPYEFKWIENLGFEMIRKITIHAGGNVLAEYSGEYMAAAIQRDEGSKILLTSEMIGNERALNDPANAFGRSNIYPNAAFDSRCGQAGIEPSIRGRQLYIPLMAWFCFDSKLALPLIALQYQDIYIRVEMRPIRELYTILNVQQPLEDIKYVKPNIPKISDDGLGQRHAPNAASGTDQMWVFTQQPPDPKIYGFNGTSTSQQITETPYPFVFPQNYPNKNNQWNTDIHLISTYVFLGNDERRQFAASDHQYLIKSPQQHDFNNVTGSHRVDLPSRNMVSSYMFRFRRSDVNLRNEWSNYSNWVYEDTLPSNIKGWGPLDGSTGEHFLKPEDTYYGANDKNPLSYFVTGCRTSSNIKGILLELGVLMGGEYRETIHKVGVYDFVEKWLRTSGFAKQGLYMYNFCIDSNRTVYQPSGAQNTDKYQYVTFEFTTIQPPRNTDFESQNNIDILCDPSGAIIGLRKDLWRLNNYNFDLRVWEERYNMIEIKSGRIGLLYAR